MTTQHRAYRLAYDGRPFSGFQRQPEVPTVEGSVFTALRALELSSDPPTNYSAAGRTDAGVSAAVQTVAFDAPSWCTPRAINAALPDSIRFWAAADVDSAFHARRNAGERAYTYHLYAPRANDELATTAATRLSGTHDFHNLTPDTDHTVREVSFTVQRDGDYLCIVAQSVGFARQLVRRVVSLVQSIASGAAPLEKVDHVLASEPLSGEAGIAPAPAFPLILTGVDYDIDFSLDSHAVDSAQRQFEDRRIEATTQARVARTIQQRLIG